MLGTYCPVRPSERVLVNENEPEPPPAEPDRSSERIEMNRTPLSQHRIIAYTRKLAAPTTFCNVVVVVVFVVWEVLYLECRCGYFVVMLFSCCCCCFWREHEEVRGAATLHQRAVLVVLWCATLWVQTVQAFRQARRSAARSVFVVVVIDALGCCSPVRVVAQTGS